MKTLLFFVMAFVFSCSPSKQGKVRQGKNGQIESASITAKCTPPQKSYAREIESNLKAEMDSLKFTPRATFDATFNQKIVQLREYSSSGLDLDLLTFRICEMANNRGLTSEQTSSLIEKAIQLWKEAGKTTSLQQTIISNNQQGGITAGVVNFEKPNRTLNEVSKKELLSIINSLNFETIDISSTLGDNEAYGFANEIYEFLKLKYANKKVGEVGQAVYNQPVYKVHIDTTKLISSKLIAIRVGSRS
jgi:hypothetical protein